MRIRFTATGTLPAYRGWHGPERIIFGPGETRDVPDAKARELLRDFPTNFVRVIEVATTEIPSAPVDRMMRKGRTKRK